MGATAEMQAKVVSRTLAVAQAVEAQAARAAQEEEAVEAQGAILSHVP